MNAALALSGALLNRWWLVPDHRDRVRALIERSSLNKTAASLRISPLTLARYVSGFPVRESTELLVDARMRELDAQASVVDAATSNR